MSFEVAVGNVVSDDVAEGNVDDSSVGCFLTFDMSKASERGSPTSRAKL